MMRPLLRYHGGKHKIGHWIVDNLPPHQGYCEPFAGAASVLMRKGRCRAEILNDLDGKIVNVFRVLRDPKTAEQLRKLCELTPYARAELELAFVDCDDPVEQARRTVTLAFMGQGSDAVTRGFRTGLRSKMRHNSHLSPPSNDWHGWVEQIPAFVKRLQGVVLECKDALLLIRQFDNPEMLFYVDPPYPLSTRSAARNKHGYRYELTDDDHRVLAKMLHEAVAMVVISGYPCDLYDEELYSDWHRATMETHSDRQQKRTEVIWSNAAAVRARRQKRMFA